MPLAVLPHLAQRLALAALLLGSGAGAAAPAAAALAPLHAESATAELRLASDFHAALGDYENNRWPEAFAAFAALADRGHAPAASLALRMHQHGPQRYGSRFGASAAQLAHWRRSLAAARER